MQNKVELRSVDRFMADNYEDEMIARLHEARQELQSHRRWIVWLAEQSDEDIEALTSLLHEVKLLGLDPVAILQGACTADWNADQKEAIAA